MPLKSVRLSRTAGYRASARGEQVWRLGDVAVAVDDLDALQARVKRSVAGTSSTFRNTPPRVCNPLRASICELHLQLHRLLRSSRAE
jgi:hypothetical protein